MRHHFTVRCMLCGRTAGLIQEGAFRRHAESPPLAMQAGRSACGFCRGSLYLEADDGPGAFQMAAFPRVDQPRPAPARRTARRRAS